MPGTMLGELLTTMLGTDVPFGPCRWPVDYACHEVPADASENMRVTMENAATELLWSLSGRQFGECGVTLRPCAATCDSAGQWRYTDGGIGSYPFPAYIDGTWLNLACGSCSGECSCGAVERVVLPRPVTRITQIIIDGVELPDSAYRVDGRLTVIRQDGGSWPRCQDLSKAAGASGTWTMFGFYGREVPGLGQLSLAELSCEFIKQCLGQSCQIPANWTSITRAGISVSRPASQIKARIQDLDVIPEEWLPMTRRFIRAYNPFGLQAPSRVWSPDIPAPTRTF